MPGTQLPVRCFLAYSRRVPIKVCRQVPAKAKKYAIVTLMKIHHDREWGLYGEKLEVTSKSELK